MQCIYRILGSTDPRYKIVDAIHYYRVPCACVTVSQSWRHWDHGAGIRTMTAVYKFREFRTFEPCCPAGESEIVDIKIKLGCRLLYYAHEWSVTSGQETTIIFGRHMWSPRRDPSAVTTVHAESELCT